MKAQDVLYASVFQVLQRLSSRSKPLVCPLVDHNQRGQATDDNNNNNNNHNNNTQDYDLVL